jgi:hypothetical protein
MIMGVGPGAGAFEAGGVKGVNRVTFLAAVAAGVPAGSRVSLPHRQPGNPGQLTTRFWKVRTARAPKTAVPPISATRIAQSGMWPRPGVRAARRPSVM